MQENFALGAITAGLALVVVLGSVADLRLAAKAERDVNAANILTAGLEECVASPAMVSGYAGCGTKEQRVHSYFAARMLALASN